MDIDIVLLTGTHVQCPRCKRYVDEVFPKWAERGYPPICSRCCCVIYDLEHGIIPAREESTPQPIEPAPIIPLGNID